jgi:hypothetical protein
MRVSRRLPAFAAAVLAVLATPWAGPVATADGPDRGTIVVTMGDATSVTLRNWSLSYEYSSYKQGTSPMTGASKRTESGDLLVGKRTVPLAGQVLSFTYDSAAASDRFKHPREIVVSGPGGKKATFKVEPPAREMLVATPEKGTAVTPRTLDLRGETITGTNKDLCLLSYTATVECGGTPADAVVKVEFQK